LKLNKSSPRFESVGICRFSHRCAERQKRRYDPGTRGGSIWSAVQQSHSASEIGSAVSAFLANTWIRSVSGRWRICGSLDL